MAGRPGFADDVRWLVVWHHFDGKTFEENAIKWIPVPIVTQRRWWRYYKTYGDIRWVRHKKARQPDMTPDEDAYLSQAVEKDHTVFVQELTQMLSSQFHRSFSASTVLRSLHRSQITHKKLDQHVLQARLLDQLEFLSKLSEIDPSRIITLGESGSDRRNLHRAFRWSLLG